jgi:hypothetical protein
MIKLTAAFTFLGLMLLNLSCQETSTYNPDEYLQSVQKDQFLYNIGRYIAKLPNQVSHNQKFDKKYDGYYQEEMKKYKIQHYFISADSTHYFLVTRPAPSLYEKRVAIGGLIRFDNEGKIATYEEVFRTWKMKEEELRKKGQLLFTSMVEKGNVDQYLADTTEDEWVEFPDERNYFDKASKRWKIVGQNDTTVYLR